MMDKATRVKENPASKGLFLSRSAAIAGRATPAPPLPCPSRGRYRADRRVPAARPGRPEFVATGKGALECAAPFRYVALRFNSRRWFSSIAHATAERWLSG